MPEAALTTNNRAHDIYLRGKEALHQRTRESLARAMTLFRTASQIDAEYAPPLLGIADTALILENNHAALSLQESSEIAKEALDKAAALDFKTSDYYATLGLYHAHWTDYDDTHVAKAEEAFRRAIELNENNVSAYMWYASLVGRSKPGNNDELALALDAKALALDPLNRIANGNRTLSLSRLGRHDEVITELKRLVEFDPGYLGYRSQLGVAYVLVSDLVNAARQVAGMSQTDSRYPVVPFLILQHFGDARLKRQFYANLPIDNPSTENFHSREFAETATRPELIARAQVILSQPDPAGGGAPPLSRRLELGEPGLAKALLENMSLTFTKKDLHYTFVGPLDAQTNIYYLAAIHRLGEKDRVPGFADSIIAELMPRRHTGFGGKQANLALCYAILGRKEDAIREIEHAYGAGWRGIYGVDFSIHPALVALAQEPRVQAVRKKIDAELGQVREQVLTLLREAGAIGEPLGATGGS